ncbi:MAG: hypothetical protein ABIV13_02010 [Fimbriimonadales bacterium]
MKKVILISSDPALIADLRDVCGRRRLALSLEASWERALNVGVGSDLMILDLLSTLNPPNRIAGYIRFGEAKMKSSAASLPLVLVGVPESYRLDGMVGWPGFLTAFVARPVDEECLEYLLDHA